MHLVVENKCVNLYLHLSILRGCVDTQLVLCLIATRVWFIRCFPYHQKNLGDPGSSRGTLEHIRVGLTLYIQSLEYFGPGFLK
jgi:hypothetical protein